MSNELVKSNGSTDLIQFDESKVALIKRTIAPTATDDELELFLHQCRRTGLDPLAKQIYFQKYNTKDGPKVSIITAIDGYRLVADRTGLYAGSDDAVFEGRVTQQRYQDSKQVPAKASVTVYKIVGGKRVPFTSSAYWDEYYPGDKMGHMWFKMPHVMLAKAAEAQALRKAFPADLSGVYTREEMDQAAADWQELPQQPATAVDTDTGEIIEGDTVEWGDLESASETPEEPEPQDARAETSPQAQAARADKRPSRKATPNGNGIDWKAKAMGKDFSPFASCIVNAGVGYNSPQHVENKLAELGENFSKDDTERLWDVLVSAKESAAA